MKVTLVLPTLDESIGIKEILPQIKKEWYGQLIILDRGSTDGTIEYAKGLGLPILVQKEQKKRGILEGYEMAHEAATGDIIILFSPDGNSIAEKILPLIEKMKVGEIPGDEPRRVGGERKMKPFQCSLGMLIQLFREFISGIQTRHRTYRVPRHNFRAV